MNQHVQKLPEQDSNLRPPVVDSPSTGSVAGASRAESRQNTMSPQADGAESDPEGATKLQSDYCDRCGKLCWGDADTAEEPVRSLDGGAVMCRECADELRAGASWAGDE